MATGTLELPASVTQQRRVNDRAFRVAYITGMTVTLLLAAIAVQSAPAPLALPLGLLAVASVVVLTKPVVGVYLVVLCSLLTDGSIAPWYPFAKNMSSRESILFLNDGIIISPLEVLLGLSCLGLFSKLVLERQKRPFVKGGLLVPILVFTSFLLLGFVYGVGTGGDRWVGVWELRPMLYLSIMYVLVTNLFTSRTHYRVMGVLVVLGLVSNGVSALWHFFGLSAVEQEALETLVDHPTAVQMNILLLATFASFMFRGVSGWLRAALLFCSVPVMLAYIISQRRAAFIALAVGILLLFFVMWKVNRRRLVKVGPVVAILAIGYIGAFWSSESAIGFPAQAIKTVIAPDETTSSDQSSDQYRVIENFDIVETIRAKPLTGVGFGQKFYRPIALPDISFFPFYEYIPHNSVLWIWLKTGVFGFVSMLYLFVAAIRSGVRSVVEHPVGNDVVIAWAGASFPVMYLVFTYVDIAWDGRSMLLLATAMAICSQFSRLPSKDDVPPAPPPPPRGRRLLKVVPQEAAVRRLETTPERRAA